MNNKTIAEMICILDKSGSMYGKEQDTIENYNRMLAELKKLPGETYITTALFSEHCRLLYHHIPGFIKHNPDRTFDTGQNNFHLHMEV